MARYTGTGRDPLGRYPEGQVVDAAAGSVEALVERGWIAPLEDRDDPARTVWQLANAVVRGDLLTDSTDRALALEHGLIDEDGAAQPKAREVVDEHEPEAAPRKQRGRRD